MITLEMVREKADFIERIACKVNRCDYQPFFTKRHYPPSLLWLTLARSNTAMFIRQGDNYYLEGIVWGEKQRYPIDLGYFHGSDRDIASKVRLAIYQQKKVLVQARILDLQELIEELNTHIERRKITS